MRLLALFLYLFPTFFYTTMKILKHFILPLAIACTFVACGSDNNDDNGNSNGGNQIGQVSKNENANDPAINRFDTRLEFPHLKGGKSLLLVHTTKDSYDKDGVNLSIEWDASKKAQRWTCYQMHKGFGGTAGRYPDFEEDPDLPADARFSSSSDMFRGSDFTRGHICPSADRQYSRDANHQTFYYSNIQPQYYSFNAGDGYTGAWVKMEGQLRTWSSQLGNEDTLYVCKGGTIDREDQILTRIKGEMIVPKYFFVALLMKNRSGYKALGFWFEHDNVSHPNLNLAGYVVNIDQLEQLTGIDFFCNLPDDTENHVEGLSVDNIIRAWGLKK